MKPNMRQAKRNFRNKLKIAAKEANETEYWLIVLESTGYFDTSFDDLKVLLKSIIKMLTAALRSLDSQSG
jgi:four helix bundle protein